jgi:hypothetical protein
MAADAMTAKTTKNRTIEFMLFLPLKTSSKNSYFWGMFKLGLIFLVELICPRLGCFIQQLGSCSFV